MREFEIVPGMAIGKTGSPLLFIVGPCVIESYDHCMLVAEHMKQIFEDAHIPFIFKSSYDKANRTSISSYRGPGLEKGLEILAAVKKNFDIPVTSDVHRDVDVAQAAEVLDMIQVPALLCRQTDLLVTASNTQKPINVKKGQFMSPRDMSYVVEKITATGNHKVMLTERGTVFGYNNLVVDMRSIPIMQGLGYPVIFDATHSVQLPGGGQGVSGGQKEFVGTLAKAAVACGCDGLFFEVHTDPCKALCDGANMISLESFQTLLPTLVTLWHATKEG